MNFMEIVRSKKAELGAVAPITENENDQVSVQGIEVTPAEVYQVIGGVLENVWLALTDNMQRSDLEPEQVAEWVEVCQWAVEAMPSRYERQRGIIEQEIDNWQSLLDAGT